MDRVGHVHRLEDEEGRVEDELRQEDGPEQRMAEHERGPFSKVLEGVSRREAGPSRLAQIGEQEHRAARQRRGQGEGGGGAGPAHQHARQEGDTVRCLRNRDPAAAG